MIVTPATPPRAAPAIVPPGALLLGLPDEDGVGTGLVGTTDVDFDVLGNAANRTTKKRALFHAENGQCPTHLGL